MSAGPRSPGAVELALASTFLDPSAARLERLRAAADRATDWSGYAPLLERHGVLVLALRNLGLAGVHAPEAPGPGAPRGVQAALEERAHALEEDARRFRLTLQRLVAALALEEVEPTLLKGASLALDLYPRAALRGMGDVDLLIAPEELGRAVRGGSAAGLVVGERSFPIWWYRLAHFHLKLVPASALQREVELHWALHHPSLLHAVRPEALRARRTPVEVGGRRVWTLDVLDRLLHLATHLASHAGGSVPAREELPGILAEARQPLRLKWLLDLCAEVERVHEGVETGAVVERAREWHAEAELAWALAAARTALPLEPGPERWVTALLEGLGSQRAGARTAPAAGRVGPVSGLDFRAGALRRIPRWILPPRAYLERRYGVRGGGLALRRVRHAAGAAGRLCAGALGLPAAWVGRAVLRPRRRRAARAACAPEKLLDQAVAWRSLGAERAEPPRASGEG